MTSENPSPPAATEPTADELKGRVLAVKSKINNSNSSYMAVVLEVLPELNTAKGGTRIRDVWNLRTSDEAITVALENFARTLG